MNIKKDLLVGIFINSFIEYIDSSWYTRLQTKAR